MSFESCNFIVATFFVFNGIHLIRSFKLSFIKNTQKISPYFVTKIKKFREHFIIHVL